jgi:SAM-dependent methyltransferase
MPAEKTPFHQIVSEYYDKDVDFGFEKRAESNPLLDRIRSDFRKITTKYPFAKVLEIGCGPGFDVAWFASEFPQAEVAGIDISKKMVALAQQRLKAQKLGNAKAITMDERGLLENFNPGEFDLVYVYFGALNTVANLGKSATDIFTLLKPGGHAVLTFVNKWYLREMLVQALKLNFKVAFSRLKKEWGGYSPNRHLPSSCYSPSQILDAFKEFNLVEKKGYSIFYPAWYNPHKLKGKKDKGDKLWEKDQSVQNSFLWSKGEYTLFVFRKP